VCALARILRRREAQAKTGLAKTQLYQQIAEGKFPKQIRLGPKAVGWLEHEVDAWIEQRIAERDSLPKGRG
jgi:prophage regulatory protein